MRPFPPLPLLLLVLLATGPLPAQRELIVRWTGRAHVPPDATARTLSPSLGIDLLRFPTAARAAAARKQLATSPAVLAVEPDRKVRFRNDPNDPRYDQQATLVRAGFPRAWQQTTGGRTADGRPIVVAILDAGFDEDHEDLRENVWTNPGEIPGDFVDNDGNGLTDDTRGWNFAGNSADHPPHLHGTGVAGILGARGNNGRGVSGTNWDVQLMLLSVSRVSEIILAYEYVLDQRRRYNASGGREGAFVVATNASFGVEGAHCREYPVWAGLYDELGQQGILTAASTANRSWDVDANGDMPTTCTSEFLLGVTNVNEDDRLYRSSGFGRSSVDLAAPGEGSLTTRPGGGYGTFGSTSAAAPLVSGAIALLYALPDPALGQRALDDPAGAARLVRDAVLGGVTPAPALRFRTVTGGILNVGESLHLLSQALGTTLLDGLSVESVAPNPAADRATLRTNALLLSPEARVRLTDVTGRNFGRRVTAAAGGGLTITVGDLPAGWYAGELTDRGRSARFRLLVH